MQRIIICLICVLLPLINTYAIPAYPYKIKVVTPHRTIYITLQGDETNKWATTDDNYTLLRNADEWYYAKECSEGYATLSAYKLSDSPAKLNEFLPSLNKNIPIRIKKTIQRSNTETHNTIISPITGERKALVILMEFADVKFTKSYDDFYALFNERGYSDDGAAGSVRDYFEYASYGQLNFTCDIAGPYTAKYNMSHYGKNIGNNGNDTAPYELFTEAVNKAIEDINLRNYDYNGDGYVDNIHIVFAGYGEEAGASSNAIWSHESTFPTIVMQDMKIDKYSCAPELRYNSGTGISRIGVHCHEMGHALGAMDYYDTDDNIGGNYEGTGNWDIMASGSWNNDGITPANFNPYVKAYNFGWIIPTEIDNTNEIVLKPSNFNKEYIYRLDMPGGDYYLLENRSYDGFDIGNPGKGLLIYHIHNNITYLAKTNTINSTHPQGCYIVCASSKYITPENGNYGNINSDGCPFPGTSNNSEWSTYSTPAIFSWYGNIPQISLKIKELNNDDITLENYIEKELVKETFSQSYLPEDWQNETLNGNNSWNVFYSMSSSLLKDKYLPSPMDNDNYIYLKNTSTSINRSRLITPLYHYEKTIIKELSLYIYSKNFSLLSNATFNIYYRKSTDEEWSILKSLTEIDDVWTQITIPFDGEMLQCQLMFEGILSGQGSICIDQITLKGIIDETTSAIPQQNISNENIAYTHNNRSLYIKDCNKGILYIYDLSGRNIYKCMTNNNNIPINLSSGIYIIHYNETAYKIFVP
ncbi:MAG: M6 family metalloprotease domain-containing protein [Coprobacter sp.]|nr:M6 family metalloprotease domain-containing protein [Coprobacter sp.]